MAQFFDSIRAMARSKSASAVHSAIRSLRGSSEKEEGDKGEEAGLCWYIEYMQDQLERCCKEACVATSSGGPLSLAQMHYIYVALELLWEWRIRRFFESRQEDSLLCLSPIEALDESVLRCGDSPFAPPSSQQTWAAIRCMSAVVHCPAFERVALQRNMGRLLVTCILLSSAGVAEAAALVQTLVRGPHQAAVVTGLQAAARCSQPVRLHTSQLLQELLLLPGGLGAVMRAYAHESMPPGLIIKVLTSTPQSATREAYFAALAPQLVLLVREAAATGRDAAVLGTCAGMVARMGELSPGAATLVLTELGRPMLVLQQATTTAAGVSLSARRNVLASHEAVLGSLLCLEALASALPSPGVLMRAVDAAALAEPLVYIALHCHACVQATAPTVERGACAALDAAAALCACLFQSCPERAASIMEHCIVFPSLNSFRAGAALTSASARTRSRVEICAGHSDVEGENHEAALEACTAVLRAGERAAALLLMLVHWFDPAAGRDQDERSSVGTMVSALCARSLSSFLQVAPSAEGNQAELATGGGGMVFLLLQQHLPPELLLRDRRSLAPILAAFFGQFADKQVQGEWGQEDEEEEGEEIGEQEEDEDESHHTVAFTALSLVHQMTLLEIAHASRLTPAKKADAPLTCLLAPLQRVAALRLPGNLSRVAAEAGLSILASSLEPLCAETPPPAPALAPGAASLPTASSAPASAPLGHVSTEIAELLQSEHPAMQALGCKALVQAYVQQAAAGGSGGGEGREAELADTMARLLRLLAEKESFVYLSALHGFVALAGVGGLGRSGGVVVAGVEEVAAGPRLPGDRAAVVSFLLESFGEKGQTVRARALCGEGLFLVVRRYGNVFGRDVLAKVAAGCLRVCRDGAGHKGSEGSEEDGVLLCASAVSVLAELVASAGPGVTYVPLHEVLEGALVLLARPDQSSLPAVGEMRRACAFLLCRCVQGLGDGLLSLDQGSVVKGIYQALKRATRDRDKVVVFHAENSLACLDEIVKCQLLGV